MTSSFQYDDSVASGNVINTTPAAGTKAEKGSTVTMLVSQGTDKKTKAEVRRHGRCNCTEYDQELWI